MLYECVRQCHHTVIALSLGAQNALGLHLTKLHGRTINVELTVGGGGAYD